MEYIFDYEGAKDEDLIRRKLILLGDRYLYGEKTDQPATMLYNPKSHVTLIIGPRGVGKTNTAKLIIGQDINNFGDLNNRKYLILDYKGIDWRTINRPQTNTKNLHPYIRPFAIENIKPYTPAYDEMKAFENDVIFGYAPSDFNIKDWMQVGKNMDTAAWQLRNLLYKHPEMFEDPEKMLEFIEGSADSAKQAKIYGNEAYIHPTTKNVLLRNLSVFQEDKALVSKSGIYRQNYQLLEDLKARIIPIMQFQKDETNPYVQFYSGKMLRDLYVQRNNEWNQGRHDIGNVTVVVEEASVIFNSSMSTSEYPAVAAIAGMIQQGRTLGFSLYLISQSLNSLHPVALDNWNNLIIGANTGPGDKELLKKMNIPEYLVEEIKNLKFNPARGQFEFMFIGNDRTKGIKFNAALSPVQTTEEAV